MISAACAILLSLCVFTGLSVLVRRTVVHNYLGLVYIVLSFLFFLSIFIVGLIFCGGPGR